MKTLFTIGHSDLPVSHLVSLLKAHRVEAVADVRSSPYSQRHPQFNRENLEASLRGAGMKYVFMGRELGARREEKECYVEGRADYKLIAKTPLFREGLERVRRGLEKMPIALLCAEGDPLTCHRTVLVCRNLRGEGIEIQHIRRDGSLESAAEAELRLLRELRISESASESPRLIENAYDLRGAKINYVEESDDTHEAETQPSLNL